VSLRTVLIDSSSWVEALRADGRAEVRVRVAALLEAGCAAWCDLVALELWNGARGSYERKKLRELEESLILLETTAAVWRGARELADRCRKAGRTVPATDLLIAACALAHGAEIEHCDAHLDEVLALVRGGK